MNFILKIIMIFSFSVYAFATCTTPETNTTGLLRLSHSVCPKLFIPHKDKEKSTISFYQNHHNMGTSGRSITVDLNSTKSFTQEWVNNLSTTLTNLKKQINSDGEFTASTYGSDLIIEAIDAGYKVDVTATGGTPVKGSYNSTTKEGNITNAELNVTYNGLKEGENAIAETVSWEFNKTTSLRIRDINFSRGIRNIKLTVDSAQTSTIGSAYSDVNYTFANLVTRLNTLNDNPKLATITTDATRGEINATSLKVGNFTTMQLSLEHNTTGTGWESVTIGSSLSGGKGEKSITQKGKNAIASIRRLHYYGNEGNYSINFWSKNTNIGNNSNNTVYKIETPYLGTMALTLNYLSGLIDANGTYNAVHSSYYGYITLTDRTPRATEHNLSGKSGNGNASVKIDRQGKATPEDINMTYMTYNDNFLYTTFDIDYDVNESDGNYSSAKQDILEIFEVTHMGNTKNVAINTINLTSVAILRHDDNVSSVVAVNDVVFLGDDNSTYYNFSRNSNTKTLTSMKKLEEPNEIENVQANMTEHFQDETTKDGYVFLADDTRLRVYKVSQANQVTHYVTHYNFGGKISDINRDGQYLYVQSNSGNMLTKFIIVSENTRFSIERVKTFTLDANKIYVRGDFVYYTMGSGANKDKGYVGKIGDTMIEPVLASNRPVEDSAVSFIVGDEFYSASIGMDGLKVYNYKHEVNATDKSYSGSRILILGEFIITDDLNSSQIRIYKFGDVSVSSREGEGSRAKPFNVQMLANKVNLDDVNWTIWKLGESVKANLRQKNPIFPFTESGLWFVRATVTYKNYPYASEYLYRVNVIEDNVPGVEINASRMTGLKGLKVDFNSTITKDAYVGSTMWDFNDTNKSESIPATSYLRDPSWVFNDAGDYNVTFIVYYDRDKNITKNIIIHISEPLEINTTNPEGNNTTTHIKGEDVNLSVGIDSNEDFVKTTGNVGIGNIVKTYIPIKSYTWSSIGARNPVSHLERPIFIYDTEGTYVVNLEIIRATDNAKFTAKKTISVVDFQKPTITADKLSGETPLTVNFGVSLKGYLAKNVRPKSIHWTFTNGATSSRQNPTYTFDTQAVNGYVVTANIELSDGKTLVLEKVIMVNDKVDLEIEANAKEGYTPLTINLTATGSSFEGINRYEWEIGLVGKEKIKKTGTSLEHTFDTNGTYEINATAFSNKDHNGTASLVIKVEKGPDVAIKGELVNPDDETIYKFTAIKEVGDTSFTDENTSWLINNTEVASKTAVMTYKFIESKAYKIEYKVVLKSGNIVKYVYDRNPSFNPYVKKVQVYTGWNLISSPLDEKFGIVATNDPVPLQATDNLQRLRDISSVIWKFNNNSWDKDPDMIEKRLGFWIKATIDKELIFDGNTNYEPDLTNLNSGNWYLVGTGKKLLNYKASNGSISVVWVYKKGKWYKNPSIIDIGEALWVKAN